MGTTQSNAITVNNQKDFIKALKNRTTPSQSVIFVDDNLRELYLGNNEITTLLNVQFPINLQRLYLYNNKITTLLNVQFPPNLQRLYLRNNSITSLLNVQFPRSLQVLYLGGNKDIIKKLNLVEPYLYNYSEIVELQAQELAIDTARATLELNAFKSLLTPVADEVVDNVVGKYLMPPKQFGHRRRRQRRRSKR